MANWSMSVDTAREADISRVKLNCLINCEWVNWVLENGRLRTETSRGSWKTNWRTIGVQTNWNGGKASWLKLLNHWEGLIEAYRRIDGAVHLCGRASWPNQSLATGPWSVKTNWRIELESELTVSISHRPWLHSAGTNCLSLVCTSVETNWHRISTDLKLPFCIRKLMN